MISTLALMSGTLIGVGLTMAGAATSDVPHQTGTVVYSEEFGNVSVSNVESESIEDYTGAASADDETYTADPQFQPLNTALQATDPNYPNGNDYTCNGYILDSTTTDPDLESPPDTCYAGDYGDNSAAWAYGQAAAVVLGGYEGAANPDTTNVLWEFSGTDASNTGFLIETPATSETIPAVQGDYYELVADVATFDYDGAGSGPDCDVADPDIYPYLLNGTEQVPLGGTPGVDPGFDPCTASGGQNIESDGNYFEVAQLVSSPVEWTGGSTMGFALYDSTSTGNGNNYAIGKIEVMKLPGPTSISTTVNTAGSTTAVTNPVPIGTSVADTTTVSRSDGVTPTGTIAYTFFSNGSCTGTGTAAGGGDLAQGLAPSSSNEGPLPTGSYGFEATYSGDSNFVDSRGSCERVTVAQGSSSVATQVDTAGSTTAITNPVAIGTSVRDTATVSHSDGFIPTGTIDYTFFSNGACTGTGTAAGGGNLTQGLAPSSSNEGPLAAGSYAFEATYSGDSNFAGSTGSCEPVTVAFALIFLEKSASSSRPEVGAEDTFTIDALSSSNSTAGSGKVVVVDRLPTGLDYVSSVASTGSAVDSGQTVTWTLADLSPGSSASMQIVVTVKTTSRVTNTATFTQTTLNSSGGRTGRSNTVTLIPTYAVLGVSETVTDPRPAIGSQDQFAAVVTNKGPDSAMDVTVTDPLPAGLGFVSDHSAKGSLREGLVNGIETLDWDVGTLAVASSATIDVIVEVTASSGSLVNPVTATDSTFDPTGQAKHASASVVVAAPVVVPPAHTGEPWSGWTYWLLLLALGLSGMAMLETVRRGRRRFADD
jgi:uncharacterized repeat protein (TIGR01451 family)